MSLLFLLLLASAAAALRLNGYEVDWQPLDASTARARRLNGMQKLWLLQTDAHPDRPLAHFGQKAFLVRSASLDGFAGNYSAYLPKYKYRENINTTRGIFVKFVDAGKKGGGHKVISGTKGYFGPTHLNHVQLLAESQNVLWISEYRAHRRHSLASRVTLVGSTAAQQGAGGRLLVSDSGVDPLHCFFYDAPPPYASLNLTG